MDDPKKTAAAIAAVFAYIQEEEAAMLQAAASARASAADRPPRPNVWGVCGRQDIMQMGTLMQMRTFGR
jgi:hypothetical protein